MSSKIQNRMLGTALALVAEATQNLQKRLEEEHTGADTELIDVETSDVIDEWDEAIEAALEARNKFCRAEEIYMDEGTLCWDERVPPEQKDS